MPKPTAAAKLLRSFKSVGMTPGQVRSLLPEWWDDEAAEEEDGLLQLSMLLARRANVEFAPLVAKTPSAVFEPAIQRFRTSHKDETERLAAGAAIGHAVARVLCSATPTPLNGALVPSPKEWRAVVVARARENRQTELSALCTLICEQGIAMAHVTNWPDKMLRPDAMCMKSQGRPAILVVRKEVAPAKLAYLVAHELGHIILGHLGADESGLLIDEDTPIDERSGAQSSAEKAADVFAMELLGGTALTDAAREAGPAMNSTNVALSAVAVLNAARSRSLDAAQVALTVGRQTGDWPLANMVIRFFQSTDGATTLINDVAKTFLDSERISSDAADHLERLTGIELQA